MGFFGHFVVSQSDTAALWAAAEPEPGPWAARLHVLRVHERLGGDWTPVEEFRDRLVENVLGGFIGASVWDSDGAFLVVGVPGQPVGRYWLSIDGVVPHFVPPWAPFDEDGNKLSPEAEAAQDAEWGVEADGYREQMLGLALSTEDAARLCVDWARHNNLPSGSVDDVAAALISIHTFVEETFTAVLESLGARTR